MKWEKIKKEDPLQESQTLSNSLTSQALAQPEKNRKVT